LTSHKLLLFTESIIKAILFRLLIIEISNFLIEFRPLLLRLESPGQLLAIDYHVVFVHLYRRGASGLFRQL